MGLSPSRWWWRESTREGDKWKIRMKWDGRTRGPKRYVKCFSRRWKHRLLADKIVCGIIATTGIDLRPYWMRNCVCVSKMKNNLRRHKARDPHWRCFNVHQSSGSPHHEIYDFQHILQSFVMHYMHRRHSGQIWPWKNTCWSFLHD